jgi:hypothetical protein
LSTSVTAAEADVLVRRREAMLSPGISLSAAVGSALMLLIAARQGQFQEIAAFGAGSGAGVLLAVLVSGGTTLAYASGDEPLRRGISRARLRLAGPALLAGAVLVGLAYEGFTALSFAGVCAGGMTAAVNHVGELEIADLQRALRIRRLIALIVAGRAGGIALALAGVGFGLCMLAATTISWILMAAASGRRATAPAGDPPNAARRAYTSALTVFVAVEAAVARIPFVAAPWVADPFAAGILVTILSTQQSVSGVLTAPSLTAMAVRARTGRERGDLVSWARSLNRSAVALAILATTALIVLRQPVLVALNVAQLSAASLWWTLACLALPLRALNCARQYTRVSDGDARAATTLQLAILTGVAASAAVALATGSLLVLVGGVVAGEVCGALAGRRPARPAFA